MEKIRLYSPRQIFLSSFLLGGPIAVIYFLTKNYLALGNNKAANKTLIYGGLLVLLMLLILPFLPENFPNLIIPIIYSVIGLNLAMSTQMKKEEIEISDEYTFQSNWVALGVAILSLILFLIFLFIIVFFLEFSGLVSFQ